MVVYKRKTTGKPEKYDFFNTLFKVGNISAIRNMLLRKNDLE